MQPIFIQSDQVNAHKHHNELHMQQISISILPYDKHVQQIEPHVQRSYPRIDINHPHIQRNHPLIYFFTGQMHHFEP